MKANWKGIPKATHEGVKAYMHLMSVKSPQVAYAAILKGREVLKAKQAEEEKAQATADAKRLRDGKAWAAKDARETVQSTVRNVATLRDMLTRMEEGELYHGAEDTAHVINCTLKENMRKMEAALMTLGIIPATRKGPDGEDVEDDGYWQD